MPNRIECLADNIRSDRFFPEIVETNVGNVYNWYYSEEILYFELVNEKENLSFNKYYQKHGFQSKCRLPS